MSHFTVLVSTPNQSKEALTAALQPFHEYECTGVKDEHVVFVDEHDNVVAEWEGEEDAVILPGGRIVRRYDDECYREPTADEAKEMGSFLGTGCSNGVRYTSRDWGDGRGYRAKVLDYERFEQTKVPVKTFWPDLWAYASDWHGYECHEGRIGRWTNPNAKWDWWKIGGRWPNTLTLKSGGKADSAIKFDLAETPETFAILHDGHWVERGSMGWWGVVTDETPDWEAIRLEAFRRIPDDAFVTVVDCHI